MTVFLLAIFLAIFIPGDLFVARLKLTLFQRVILSFGVGLVLWALQGFIFGFLGFRTLTFGYIAICLVLWLWLKRWRLLP